MFKHITIPDEWASLLALAEVQAKEKEEKHEKERIMEMWAE